MYLDSSSRTGIEAAAVAVASSGEPMGVESRAYNTDSLRSSTPVTSIITAGKREARVSTL